MGSTFRERCSDIGSTLPVRLLDHWVNDCWTVPKRCLNVGRTLLGRLHEHWAGRSLNVARTLGQHRLYVCLTIGSKMAGRFETLPERWSNIAWTSAWILGSTFRERCSDIGSTLAVRLLDHWVNDGWTVRTDVGFRNVTQRCSTFD